MTDPMPVIRRRICRGAVVIIVLLQILLPILPVLAEVNPQSGMTGKDSSGIQDLDLTISLDWDPDKVTGTEKDPRGMTRVEFQTNMENFAKSVFSMTNGLHRLRNIYVFKKKDFWDMADIRYISTEAATSNANVSGWKKKGNVILMYVYEDYDSKTKGYRKDEYPGPVLAHECGHYIYGIFDEYQDKSSKAKTMAQLRKEKDLGTPASDDDGTQESIMNHHGTYPNWFSVAGGYTETKERNTAQFRMFEKSIWSTIVSDPAQDHQNARDFKREWFDAFKDKNVTAVTAEQTKPLAGYKDNLKIVWMKSAGHTVMLMDNNVSIDIWPEVVKGCAAAIRTAKDDNWMTILKGDSVVAARTKLSGVTKDSLIAQVKAQIQGAKVSVDKALQAAIAQVNLQRSEMGSDMLNTIRLLTEGAPLISSSMTGTFADAKAMLSVDTYGKHTEGEPPGGQTTVTDLSEQTGGRFTIAKRPQMIKANAARGINLLEYDSMTDIAEAFHPGPLTAGGAHTLGFVMGPRDEALEITFFVMPDESGNVQPTLTDPNGRVLTNTSVAAGFSVEEDSETGMWIFRIEGSSYAGAVGSWTAALTASLPVNEPLIIVATARSNLTMTTSVRVSPLFGYVAQVSLKADRPVLGARVSGAVYDTNGNLMANLTLHDDGQDGDVKIEDGIYSARIPYLAEGEYGIVAWADDNDGSAVESDRRMSFGISSSVKEAATGAFERTDESAFRFSLNTSSGGGSRGGLCFIAEAAYGSFLDPHVDELRHFRDQWLLACIPGQLFIRYYYNWSPDVAFFIRKSDTARLAARIVLTPVVYSVRYPLLSLALLTAPVLFWQRRRLITFIRRTFRRR